MSGYKYCDCTDFNGQQLFAVPSIHIELSSIRYLLLGVSWALNRDSTALFISSHAIKVFDYRLSINPKYLLTVCNVPYFMIPNHRL